MAEPQPLQKIDLTGIIRSRVTGWKGRLIPGFLLRGLEKLVCQDRLNELLEATWPAEGSEFSYALMKELGVTVEVEGLENLPVGEPLVFASNHPLGGFDGIALTGVLGRRYGDDNVRVLVNDMLMNVWPLKNVFLPVNKYGKQARRNAEMLNRAFSDGKNIVTFPAGLVSRLGDDGMIRDLQWQKAFVVKALEYGRRIVPVRFEGVNSMRFYRTARLRSKLGLKVNIEQALLPSELCRAGGKSYRITFLPPVDPAALAVGGMTPKETAAYIREMLYKQ